MTEINEAKIEEIAENLNKAMTCIGIEQYE
jgi:hypothetical protein